MVKSVTQSDKREIKITMRKGKLTITTSKQKIDNLFPAGNFSGKNKLSKNEKYILFKGQIKIVKK